MQSDFAMAYSWRQSVLLIQYHASRQVATGLLQIVNTFGGKQCKHVDSLCKIEGML